MPTSPSDHTPRLLAKVLRTVLAEHRDGFASLADLTEALKRRCARMKIAYGPDAITACYELVSSNRPLLAPRTGIPIACRHRRVADGRCLTCGWVLPDAKAVTHAEARAVLLQFGVGARQL